MGGAARAGVATAASESAEQSTTASCVQESQWGRPTMHSRSVSKDGTANPRIAMSSSVERERLTTYRS